MAKREIIEIDRDKCDGCGLCTEACAEGALVLDDENKAVLAKEIYCDGMGACLDVCPIDALKIVEKEGEAYDKKATYQHVLKTRGKEAAASVHGIEDKDIEKNGEKGRSSDVPPTHMGCPGCTAFALGSFHQDLLKEKKLIIACPKLDDTSGYIEKIAEILKNNTIYSLTVAIMVVPCCSGLSHIVEKAVELSGTQIKIKRIVIGLNGEIIS
jgi:ferredoxin